MPAEKPVFLRHKDLEVLGTESDFLHSVYPYEYEAHVLHNAGQSEQDMHNQFRWQRLPALADSMFPPK